MEPKVVELMYGKEGGPMLGPSGTADTYVVKNLWVRHVRRSKQDFEGAAMKKMEGLARREIGRKVARESLAPDAKILSERLVNKLKTVGNPAEMAKVCIVAQGHNDRDKIRMVHDVSALRAISTQTVLSVASCLEFCVFSHDVTQDYLQSKYRLTLGI